MVAPVKLGLQLGYRGAQPPTNRADLVTPAEDASFDTVFTAEAWGSDAFTPLAWWGSSTSRIRLGTSIVQLSARTSTACAMTSLTLDHLSGGRHALGLGVSGLQVVEGDRAINWADLQTLVPRVTDTAPPGEDAADGGWWVPDVTDVLGEFVHHTGRYRQITQDEVMDIKCDWPSMPRPEAPAPTDALSHLLPHSSNYP
jgi:alkanesulfonate monooxygenase SsuD/methylene tetrahydromethanopterin reductase-like flavin-dependent oxidoreductase (luciferase family)